MGHSSYSWGLSGGPSPPPPEDLRREDPARPTVGDLIKPGQLIDTSYASGPYRVESVEPHEVYPGFMTWSLIGLRVRDGVTLGESSRGWINEVVVEWDGDTPRFRMLFQANDDEVLLIDGVAYGCNKRTGQLSLF